MLARAVVALFCHHRFVLAIAPWGRRQSPAIRAALGFPAGVTPQQTTVQRLMRKGDPLPLAAARTDCFAAAAPPDSRLFPGPINDQVGKAVLGDAALYQIAYPAGVDGRIPTGRQYFSARGDTTARTATAPFDLLPSQVDP